MLREISRQFRIRSAREMAKKEFEDAQRELLEAQTAVEYASALVTYNQNRVDRLSAYIGNE